MSERTVFEGNLRRRAGAGTRIPFTCQMDLEHIYTRSEGCALHDVNAVIRDGAYIRCKGFETDECGPCDPTVQLQGETVFEVKHDTEITVIVLDSGK